ncbi:hypothetical protein PMIN06_000184 [Paraphaeosphaeria minitans]
MRIRTGDSTDYDYLNEKRESQTISDIITAAKPGSRHVFHCPTDTLVPSTRPDAPAQGSVRVPRHSVGRHACHYRHYPTWAPYPYLPVPAYVPLSDSFIIIRPVKAGNPPACRISAI